MKKCANLTGSTYSYMDIFILNVYWHIKKESGQREVTSNLYLYPKGFSSKAMFYKKLKNIAIPWKIIIYYIII